MTGHPTMYHRIKRQVYILLHPELGNTRWDKIINAFLVILILLNLLAVLLETEPAIYGKYGFYFDAFDTISVGIFSVEYLLRLWSANEDPKYSHWFRGRLKYVVSWEALVDLLAILPFYLHSIFVFDLRELRLLRLARMLRIFRLTKYTRSTRMIGDVFRHRIKELLISFILTSGLIVIAACLMYFAEHNAQPDKFKSIPETLYWSVVTLTTTGYGDVFPITGIGKILTGVLLMVGVAFFALPAGIITAGFLEESRKQKHHKVIRCPHCGEPIDLHEIDAGH
jgi:voltage-gated potassium channel